MNKVSVKANKELFDRWRQAGASVTALASVVQNDMEIEVKDLMGWGQQVEGAVKRIRLLRGDTMDYLSGRAQEGKAVIENSHWVQAKKLLVHYFRVVWEGEMDRENVEEIGNIVDEIMTAVKEEIDGGEEVGG